MSRILSFYRTVIRFSHVSSCIINLSSLRDIAQLSRYLLLLSRENKNSARNKYLPPVSACHSVTRGASRWKSDDDRVRVLFATLRRFSRKYDFVRGKALDIDSYAELHRSFNHITRLRRASVSPSFCFDLIE